MAHGVAIFVTVIVVVLILAAISWFVYSRLHARRLGLPPPSLNPFSHSSSNNYPSPAPGGIVGWVNDKFRAFKNRRTAGGAYEGPATSGSRRGRRGFGPLDPDEAWDTRVGNEADVYGPGGYYEEQELGLHGGTGPYGGNENGPSTTGAGATHADDDYARGRSRSREVSGFIGGSKGGLDDRYDEETGRKPAQDPFADVAESSEMNLRSVSPRPLETGAAGHASKGSHDDSPTERRSMFRENM